MKTSAFLLIVFGAGLTALGGIFLKRGAALVNYGQLDLGFLFGLLRNYNLLIGLTLYVIPIALWIYLLREYELSKIQPLLSMVYIFTAVLAMIMLGEKVGPMRWVGIGFITLGVVFVSRS